MWQRGQVHSRTMTLTVEEVTPAAVRLRLNGSFLLANAPDPAKAGRGFDGHLLGYIGYDRAKKVINRFDVVAVGDHWSEGNRARPGRMPLGVAFELTSGRYGADLVPPQAARNLRSYFGLDR
jgi:hypothetical protein